MVKTLQIYNIIAADKALFLDAKYWYFSYFSMKTYVVGTSNEVRHF